MSLYRKDKDGNLLPIANNFVQKYGKTALETKFLPKVRDTPDYYINNDFIFSYDQFNRLPVKGDNFISVYECTSNRLSYLCTWVVVNIDGSAKCRIEHFTITGGINGILVDEDTNKEYTYQLKIKNGYPVLDITEN